MQDTPPLPWFVGTTILVIVVLIIASSPAHKPPPTPNNGSALRPPPFVPKGSKLPKKFRPLSSDGTKDELYQIPINNDPLPAVFSDEVKGESSPEGIDEVIAPVPFERLVMDKDSPKVAKVDEVVSKQGFLAWFGGSGKTPGCFAYPRALVTTPKGRLYVVDKSGRIQRYSPDGRLEMVIRTPKIDLGKPTGLGIANDGRVLVADTHYARVLIYSPDLALLGEFGSAGPKPGSFMFVTDVCEGPDGRFYVADYGDTVARIQIFDPKGKHLHSFGTFGSRPGEFQRPMALVINNRKEELYVADAVNHRLQVFDLEGRYKRSLGGLGDKAGRLKYPYDVTIDSSDRLWISEFGNHRLQVLEPKLGQSLGMIGVAGRRLGQVAFPWGVALTPDGRFYFLDSGNDRVYIGSMSAILKKGNEKT